MKPKAIFLIWLAATTITLSGVLLFTTHAIPVTISRPILWLGILLSLIWVGGLMAWLTKRIVRQGN